MLALLQRIKEANVTFKGNLEFVNNWQYFSLGRSSVTLIASFMVTNLPKDPTAEHDQITTTGPYAGTLSAFTTGTKLRTRYLHLLASSSLSHPINFWASDCNRVIETARYFATGFFGLDWDSPEATTPANLHIIPETPDRGANTLTPGDTCLKYRQDLLTGHDYGLIQLEKFRSTYLPAISARFRKQNPGIEFSNGEIYSMQEMCGFEILVRGSSPWCDVFTHEEWRDFEYARDVIHFYRAGPGNKFGAAMGWLWVNATINLLEKGPEAGRLFMSFVHDGDVVPMLAALGWFSEEDGGLSVERRDDGRKWRMSQVVPMNGRVIFERLTCQVPKASEKRDFVRVNINDGIFAVPGCNNGPGHSCPLEEFLAMVRRRGREIGDFGEVCGVDEEMAKGITFLHQ
ncbi:MAG: hypothetical protein Q9174_001221, partial [Haloplaca sp. 1 TL-2023]